MSTPAMTERSIPVGELTLDEANVRKHDRRNRDAIKRSLGRFGQQKPIVALADGTVIAGNGTLEAARELGWETLRVAVWECDDPDQARAYAIADNRTAELAEWDEVGLAEQLQQIGGLADWAGWTGDEVDDALADAELHEGSDDPTRDRERMDRFFGAATRALIIKLPLADYQWAVAQLETITTRDGLDSNADALVRILETHTGDDAP